MYLIPGACADLPSLPNSEITYSGGSTNSRPMRTIATYTCTSGYTLSGDTAKTCGSDGQWIGSDPVCQGTEHTS